MDEIYTTGECNEILSTIPTQTATEKTEKKILEKTGLLGLNVHTSKAVGRHAIKESGLSQICLIVSNNLRLGVNGGRSNL